MKKILLPLISVLFITVSLAQNYDMAVNSITMPDNIDVSNAPVNVTAVVRNLGSQTVNSFDLYMSENGQAPKVFSYSGLTLDPSTNYSVLRFNGWDPPKPGSYSLKMWVSNINNGEVDENNINDTLSKTFNAIDQIVQRNAFHEVFTSSTCPLVDPEI